MPDILGRIWIWVELIVAFGVFVVRGLVMIGRTIIISWGLYSPDAQAPKLTKKKILTKALSAIGVAYLAAVLVGLYNPLDYFTGHNINTNPQTSFSSPHQPSSSINITKPGVLQKNVENKSSGESSSTLIDIS